MRVVCAGHVNWDVTLRLDQLPVPDGESLVRSRHQSGGGSAANVAAALPALDVSTGIVGSVGDDEHGLLARRDLESAGVDLGGLRVVEGATAVKYLLVEDGGEVAVLGADGVNEAVDPVDVDPSYVGRADHAHLTGQRPETATRIAEVAADAGMTVSFDPGRRSGDRDYGAVIERADVLFLNDREACRCDWSAADRLVAVTRGTDGATLSTPGGRYAHEGYPLASVDSTGAGDAFAAGFLAAWVDGADPEEALAVANACGALAAACDGPKADLSWDAVERVRDGDSG